MRTTRVPISPCPQCGAKLDAATSVNGEMNAVPDGKHEVTICINCGALLKFGLGLILEPLTVADMGSIPTATLAELAKAQRIVLDMRLERRRGNFRNN
jgi:hypothetical protein